MVGCLIGWLVGSFVGWLVGLLACWLVETAQSGGVEVTFQCCRLLCSVTRVSNGVLRFTCGVPSLWPVSLLSLCESAHRSACVLNVRVVRVRHHQKTRNVVV